MAILPVRRSLFQPLLPTLLALAILNRFALLAVMQHS